MQLPSSFSGVVRVDRGSEVVIEVAQGMANRAYGVANTPDTRVGVASAAKGLTALTVMALIERGALTLDTRARSVLGADLPLIDDRVTVEHLLAHRSGIGDYLDEDTAGPVTDYVMPVPVHQLDTTEHYLPILGGHPQKFAPGEQFAYSNGGFVVLALIAERAGGASFYDLVDDLVCRPARMSSTAFLRSDELPGDAAIGYIDATGPRTNVLHLPVRGCGDGGVYTTAADVRALWCALFAGQIVSPQSRAEMVRPRSLPGDGGRRYGLGFWLHPTTDAVMLEGYDAGASFRSVHDAAEDLTYTAMSNWTDGAWPVVRQLADEFDT